MKRSFKLGDSEIIIDIIEVNVDIVKFYYNETLYTIRNEGDVFSLNDAYFKAQVSDDRVAINGQDIELATVKTERTSSSKSHGGDMLSPMPGKILKQCLNVGDTFAPGDAILVMEAMKMEHTVKASVHGKLLDYLVTEGQLIEGSRDLISFELIES